jgi:O-acetyl-ADP-ribose deacetylase (regulator of RNase III)
MPLDDEIDDRAFMVRHCFVIMPFGEKIDTSKLTREAGATHGMPDVIDFDAIYRDLIKPAVQEAAGMARLKIHPIRSDEAGHSGFIHREMLEEVVSADIAIVDITTANPNVFYELGVRHSFRRATTILIRRHGTHTPFNIAGMRVFSYSDISVKDTSDPDQLSPLERSRRDLARIIAASVSQRENDSLVHQLLPETSVVRESWPIMERKYVWYDVLDRHLQPVPHKRPDGTQVSKTIGFITGDILNIKDVDVWVNAENTKMQMARYHDGSVSSNIRYYGADRGRGGHVQRDTIANAIISRLGPLASVEPGFVVATESGALEERNGVKMIIHVAALQGEPGRGYVPVRDYPGCVRRVLDEIDQLNSRPAAKAPRGGWFTKPPPLPPNQCLTGRCCTSVIFPLFGSRSFGQHPQTVAENLYRAAVVFLEQNPQSQIETVWFLAYTDSDLELCERAMGLLESQGRLRPSSSVEGAERPPQFC